MLQINPIASNMTELSFNNGLVLFSYETPVAAYINNVFYATEKKWSKTTSRHINKWLDGHKAEVKPQDFFDNMVKQFNVDI